VGFHGFGGNILDHFHVVSAEILGQRQEGLVRVLDERVRSLVGAVIADILKALLGDLRPQD
jgi:hypothetical protein